MATILQFPVKQVLPVGQYMCVLDTKGQPFAIGREESVFYLSNPDERMIAYSRQFQDVLQALAVLLTSEPDGAA